MTTKNNTKQHSKTQASTQHFVLDVCIGHRGLAAHAPENTLAGIHKAASAGFLWIEIDVRLSSDNIAVLSHDADLWRCCGKRGSVSSHSANALSQIIANHNFAKKEVAQNKKPQSEKLINECIPSLSDAIKVLTMHNMGVVIEIKPARNCEEKTVRAVADALPSDFHRVMISSFSISVLCAAKKILPHIPRAYNHNLPNSKSMASMKTAAAANIHCGTQVSKAMIKKFTTAGYGVYCFTIDSTTRARKILNAGAHGIFCNTNILSELKKQIEK